MQIKEEEDKLLTGMCIVRYVIIFLLLWLFLELMEKMDIGTTS